MVCQSCGKALVRGYSFCMECGTPVPPEALAEAGMPPRTGDHAETTSAKKSDTRSANNELDDLASGGMPDIKPLMSGGNEDENSDGKTLAFCKNCGTVMQSNPDTCEKCGQPLAGSSNIPLFRNTDDDFGESGELEEDIDLAKMLGMGGIVEEDEMQAETAKMFGIGGGGIETDFEQDNENQFSAADLETLNMQMSKYSRYTSSEMPLVGRDVPEPEPKPAETPQIVDKNAPIIAETEFIPESGEFIEETTDESEEHASVEPMQEKPPQRVSYPEPKPESEKPPQRVSYPEPKPIEPEKPHFIEPEPPTPMNSPDLEDSPFPGGNPQTPEAHMPKYLYFGIIIIILCLTIGIILANMK